MYKLLRLIERKNLEVSLKIRIYNFHYFIFQEFFLNSIKGLTLFLFFSTAQ